MARRKNSIGRVYSLPLDRFAGLAPPQQNRVTRLASVASSQNSKIRRVMREGVMVGLIGLAGSTVLVVAGNGDAGAERH
jgi:hypothetical protein